MAHLPERDATTKGRNHVTVRTQPTTSETKAPARPRPGTYFAVFFLMLAAVIALKAHTLEEPPLWDGSFSVFPAGATLATTGFDIPALLDEPGYLEGGPNVHTLSLVTLVTGAAIRWFHAGDLVLPVLHGIHFVIAAAAGLGLFRIAARVLSRRLAVVTALAGLLAPVVMTQAGTIYVEMPILAVTVWAAVAFLEDRRRLAIWWAVLAVLVKQSGIIVGAGLAVATLFDPRPERRDVRAAVVVVGIPLAVATVLIALGPPTSDATSFASQLLASLGPSARFLLRTPDVLLLLLLFLLLRPAVAKRPMTGGGSLDEAVRVESLVRSLLVSFAAFYVVGGGLAFSTLPRYWSQVLPFIIIGLATTLRRLLSEQAVTATITVLCVLFVLNVNGWLYPAIGQNNFAIAERSGEYQSLLDVELSIAAAIAALPDDAAVFYTQAHHYWVTYPDSGYVDEPVPNGVNILQDPRLDDPQLAAFPDAFYVAYESGALGGRALNELVRQAEADPAYTTEVDESRSGEFSGRLVRITRTG
jgi:hypothetical protein